MEFLDVFKVPKADQVKEEFEIDGDYIYFNISKQNIEKIFYKVVDILNEPYLFILECPLKQDEEEKIRKSNYEPFHKKIYYMGEKDKNFILNLLKENLANLLNNGLISYGIASPTTSEEFMFSKYDVAYFYSKSNEEFVKFLQELGFKQTNKLTTAWDTFERNAPGQAYDFTADDEEKNIDSFIDKYTKYHGMFLSRIEEN